MEKRFIEERALIEDSYRLAVKIYQSGYRPDFIVGLWRGGQYLGLETDHIAIRTSYRGMDDYMQKLQDGSDIHAHGLQYLFEEMNAGDNLLIVDDVYSTGRNVAAVISRLRAKTRQNMSRDVRVAAPYYRSDFNRQNKPPDYFLEECQQWLVLPYELTGLTADEIATYKPWVKPVLDDLIRHSKQ